MSESFKEQISRVELMAQDEDGMTWDFSEHDLLALRVVLQSHQLLLAALQGMVGLHDDPTPYDSATTIAAARNIIRRAEGRD